MRQVMRLVVACAMVISTSGLAAAPPIASADGDQNASTDDPGPSPTAETTPSGASYRVTYYVQPAAAPPTAAPTSTPVATPTPVATQVAPPRIAVGKSVPATGSARTGAPAGGVRPSANTPISSQLNDLIAAHARGALAQQAQISGARVQGDQIQVTVKSTAGQSDAAAAAIVAAGGTVSTRYRDWLDAELTPDQITQISQASAVASVDLPLTPVPDAFTPLSEGWPLINASAWQFAGLAGNGVKVGIIDAGFLTYTSLLGTRLPSTVDTSCTQVPVESATQHGTAVSEIVHDIAPGAQLYFAAISTGVQLGAAERCLANAGVSVINMSLGFGYDGPGNGTGLTQSVIDDAVAQNVFVSVSSGNNALAHWSGAWTDPDNDGFLNFTPTDPFNQVFLSAGQAITVFLRWDDPWGASCNDFDLGLADPTMSTFVAASANPQTCSQNPLEAFSYVAAASGNYSLMIEKFSANGNPNFDLMVLTQQTIQFHVAADSLTAPADSASAGMATVGATPWNNPLTLEQFSSQGPTNDGRVKPDLVGPDGVSTTTFGNLAFLGTSAASPHVAGAAALVKQANPGFVPSQIKSFLQTHAVDLGPPGPDNQFGIGRLDLGLPPAPCTGRPSIGISVARAGTGLLSVALTPDARLRLRNVSFGNAATRPNTPVNALIDIQNLVGMSGNFFVDLQARPSFLGFTIHRPAPTSATTVPMVVTDGCGAWPTLAGAGT